MVPLKIQTKESASNGELKQNVLANLEIMQDCDWLQNKYTPHNREAILVSYGSSFRDNPEGLKEILKEKKDYDIFTVKHCLPLFKELGIEPDYCVILDPREVLGVSTLGHKRSDLFKDSNAKAFMVASMTHPSATNFLKSMGKHLIGWHSACEAMRDPQIGSMIDTWIVGGSCSAMRTISIARVMGYRKITLHGFDATVPTPKDWIEKQREAFDGVVKQLDMGLEKEQETEVFEKLFPAMEFFGAKKAMMMQPQEKDENGKPVETVMHLMEHIKNGPNPKDTFMKVLIGNDFFWGTPELIAIGQDLEMVFKTNTDVTYDIRSGGLCKAIWDIKGGAYNINPVPSEELPK